MRSRGMGSGALSSFLSLRDKSTEAIALQRKAVDMVEKLLGVRHAWTAVAREQLVTPLVRDTQYEEAEALQRNYLMLAREPDAST